MINTSQNSEISCPCGSQLSYELCCGLYHQGKSAENALILMKSRYSAYAKHQYDYIISTTHPKSPLFLKNTRVWCEQIKQFSKNTQFLGLEVLDHQPGELESYVTFIAHLKQGEAKASFKEQSRFFLERSQWFYYNGKISPV